MAYKNYKLVHKRLRGGMQMHNWNICRDATRKQVQGEGFFKIIIIAVAGFTVGKVSEIIVKLIKGKQRKLISNSCPRNLFNVNGIYSSEDGFELTFGDIVKVLEQDEEYALIRKKGEVNKPHRIPVEVLKSLLEYK